MSMTREEAIEFIEAIHVQMFNSGNSKWTEACDVAIEALGEMSVEEYRQRLMEVFHRTDHDELLTCVVMPKEEEFKSLEYILRQYKYEPRPRGEWILVKPYTFACSLCGRLEEHQESFCNCGADMRGEANEID
jgi:hypothetical protein